MDLAPIVLFVYDRPDHTLKTLESLANNILANESILYIFADGQREDADELTIRNVERTREIIKEKKWCKTVNLSLSETNKGLADSIIEGVTSVLDKYEKVIILEDDILTSPCFLEYMNKSLQLYQNDPKVMHVSAFVPITTSKEELPETYFLHFMSCWGWGTWKRAWDGLITDVDFLSDEVPKSIYYKDYNLNGAVNMFEQIQANKNKLIKTWAIKWYSTIFLKRGLCLYPHKSLVRNIGFDGSGENCGSDVLGLYNVDLLQSIKVERIPQIENIKAKKYLQRFYRYGNDSSIKRQIITKIKKIVKIICK